MTLAPLGPLHVAAIAAASCVVLVPFARRAAARVGLVDVPHGRKNHPRPTPLLGGLAIYLAIVASMLPAALASDQAGPVAIIAIAGAMLVAGAIDDWRPLAPHSKLAAQLGAAVLLVISGFRLRYFGEPVVDSIFTVALVIAVTNAVNLLDNMNGLAAGLVAIAAAALGVLEWIGDGAGLPLLAAAVVGACVGFLPFNFPRASIFMGDAGALMLGFLLSSITITALNSLDGVAWTSAWLPLSLLLADTTLVTTSRVGRGLNPFTTPGSDHISHRLARRFGGRANATAICWAAAAVAGVAGILLALAGARGT